MGSATLCLYMLSFQATRHLIFIYDFDIQSVMACFISVTALFAAHRLGLMLRSKDHKIFLIMMPSTTNNLWMASRLM